jgi:hypothetical protein
MMTEFAEKVTENRGQLPFFPEKSGAVPDFPQGRLKNGQSTR